MTITLPQLIGMGGKRGAGKNTCAEFLYPHDYIPVSFAAALKDLLARVYQIPRLKLEGLTPDDRAWRVTPHSNLKASNRWKYWGGNLEAAIEFVYGPFPPNLIAEPQYIPQAQINGLSFHQAVQKLSAGINAIERDLTPVEAMHYIATEVFQGIWEDTWIEKLKRTIQPALEQGGRYVITHGRFGNEARMIKSLGGLVVYIERPTQEQDPYGNHASEQNDEFRALANVRLINDLGLAELEKQLFWSLERVSKEVDWEDL